MRKLASGSVMGQFRRLPLFFFFKKPKKKKKKSFFSIIFFFFCVLSPPPCLGCEGKRRFTKTAPQGPKEQFEGREGDGWMVSSECKRQEPAEHGSRQTLTRALKKDCRICTVQEKKKREREINKKKSWQGSSS